MAGHTLNFERGKTMNKTYRAKMLMAIEQMQTADLNTLFRKLTSWESNHEKKKKSYFWRPPTSASSRRWEEKQKTFEDAVTIGEDTICYVSDCSMSCRNIYWTDGLRLENNDGVKVTFGDIATIREFTLNALNERKGEQK